MRILPPDVDDNAKLDRTDGGLWEKEAYFMGFCWEAVMTLFNKVVAISGEYPGIEVDVEVPKIRTVFLSLEHTKSRLQSWPSPSGMVKTTKGLIVWSLGL